MGYRELLRTQPRFRRLWLGQIVSECGDWLQVIALLRLFPTSGGAALALAGIFVVRMLPWVVWAPVSGVVADRFHRGRVMVVTDLGRALVVLGYLLVDGPEDAGLVYGLMFAQESLSAFFEPARAAVLPQIVERRALLAANSLAGATWSAMLAVGAALGGALAATVGSRAAFVIDAATFVLSALLIAGIEVPPLEREEGDAAPARDRFGVGALREGARYLAGHGAQAAAALVKGLWGMSGGIVFLFSIYAGEIFTPKGGDPAGATGVLYAGRGLGALAGPLIARRFLGESVAGLRRSIQIAFPMAALAFAAFAYAPSLAPPGQASLAAGALLLVVAHAGGSIAWVNSTQLLQLTVPNALQGRVFSVELAALTLTMSLSNAGAGAAIAQGIADARAATFAMAAAAVVSAVVWAVAMARLGERLELAAEARRAS